MVDTMKPRKSRRGPTPKSAPEHLCHAVRELREALGETQEQFAARLKASVRSVARYETTRPPSGVALAKLIAIARSEGLRGSSFAEKFRTAIRLEHPESLSVRFHGALECKSTREWTLCRLVIAVLRDAERSEVALKAANEVIAAVEPWLHQVITDVKHVEQTVDSIALELPLEPAPKLESEHK